MKASPAPHVGALVMGTTGENFGRYLRIVQVREITRTLYVMNNGAFLSEDEFKVLSTPRATQHLQSEIDARRTISRARDAVFRDVHTGPMSQAKFTRCNLRTAAVTAMRNLCDVELTPPARTRSEVRP